MLFRKYCKMSISVNQRSIGSQGLKASTLGYGAMGLTAFYGPPSEDENSIGSFCIHLGIKTVFKTKYAFDQRLKYRNFFSSAIIKRCVERGVNFIDTAEVYRCQSPEKGWKTNESVVGSAIQAIGRDKVVVCTKHFPGGWEAIFLGKELPNTKEDLRTVIKTACENSLKELNIDCIDLYYLHRMYPDPIEIEDVMEIYKGEISL